jgi:hypothetical protein
LHYNIHGGNTNFNTVHTIENHLALRWKQVARKTTDSEKLEVLTNYKLPRMDHAGLLFACSADLVLYLNSLTGTLTLFSAKILAVEAVEDEGLTSFSASTSGEPSEPLPSELSGWIHVEGGGTGA